MPKENQTDPLRNFVPRLLPWLLGGIMLVVYWLTLNHWVTLFNLTQVASAAGWTWQSWLLSPILLAVTLPFRYLPAGWIPVAMSLFASLCAAATLAILARSVAILPHDRTDLERMREHSDFSFLTGWLAWVPPITAVVYVGFHLGFWENATSFSGEIFELLWFAFILWQLLEYRLDEREGRLFLAAALYGAGMVENWALVGFFPLFLTMIIWMRRLSFFNGYFLLRMTAGGVAGILSLLLVLIPLAGRFSGTVPVGFFDAILVNWHATCQAIELVRISEVRHCLAVISLTSFLPALAMSIRWSATFGDSSRIGTTLVNYCMHFVNFIFLGILAWVAFDPPISPVQVLSGIGSHGSALTIYYISAVCLGYYSGYFLLVFGKSAIPTRRNNRPEPVLPKGLLWLCPLILTVVLASLAIGAGLLIYKNTRTVLAANDDSLQKFARFTAQQLPPGGAILLSDSDSSSSRDVPFRAYAVQSELARDGRWRKYPVVDTSALQYPQYHRYLHQHFPDIWPAFFATNGSVNVPPLRILSLLDRLSQSNQLCYLNPSFGYFFELFYQEPHGLIYTLKSLPTNSLLPPRLSPQLIADNDAFWQQVIQSGAPAVRTAVHPPDLAREKSLIGWFMAHLHVKPEGNPTALAVGEYYSKSLDALGVQVQRAGDLKKAATYFNAAQELNTNNVVAALNLEFNKNLRLGTPTTVDLSRVAADQFGKYTSWNEVIGANGPFDETSFCFGVGCWMLQGRLTRQAAVEFDRVRELAPNNLAARLFLGQIYLVNHNPDLALEALHDPMTHPFRFALTDFNSTELNELVASIYFAKRQNAEGVALLETEMSRHPDDEQLLLVAARTFNVLGLHTNALNVINRKLSHTPNDPDWLFGKGMASLQAGANDEAVTVLSKYLETRTNPAALYDRGLAYFRGGHLDESRADFLRLQNTHTNNPQLAFCLGEIAWRQHQTNEVIRNYRIFLTTTSTNGADHKMVSQRMTDLGAK